MRPRPKNAPIPKEHRWKENDSLMRVKAVVENLVSQYGPESEMLPKALLSELIGKEVLLDAARFQVYNPMGIEPLTGMLRRTRCPAVASFCWKVVSESDNQEVQRAALWTLRDSISLKDAHFVSRLLRPDNKRFHSLGIIILQELIYLGLGKEQVENYVDIIKSLERTSGSAFDFQLLELEKQLEHMRSIEHKK